MSFDIIVIGSGPAGLAIAVACAELRLKTLCVAPDVEQIWPNHYACWIDEVKNLGIIYKHQWSVVQVYTNESRLITINRSYGLIDNAQFKVSLVAKFKKAQGKLLEDKVENVSSNKIGSRVLLQSGRAIDARLVIDATGFGSKNIAYNGSPGKAAQRAYGLRLTVEKHNFDLNTAVLMDFRSIESNNKEFDSQQPTFVYVMPLSHTQLFIEETSLVAVPPMPYEILSQRLAKRIKQLGISIKKVESVEHCHIIMDMPLPHLSQPIVAFGAAAAMVHPATGYSVARSLSLAPKMAAAIKFQLYQTDNDSASTANNIWKTLWPLRQRLLRCFFLVSTKLLSQLSLKETQYFFYGFFSSPQLSQKKFLAAKPDIISLSTIGISLFRHIPIKLFIKILFKLTIAIFSFDKPSTSPLSSQLKRQD